MQLEWSSKVGKSAATIMIKNGLYLITTKMLDGADVVNNHVMVLRDGTMRGGGAFFYTFGSYTSSGGKWKGEATAQWSASDLPARIPMTVPNSTPQRSLAHEARESNQSCGCSSRIEKTFCAHPHDRERNCAI
jgi:hypothetical protein